MSYSVWHHWEVAIGDYRPIDGRKGQTIYISKEPIDTPCHKFRFRNVGNSPELVDPPNVVGPFYSFSEANHWAERYDQSIEE